MSDSPFVSDFLFSIHRLARLNLDRLSAALLLQPLEENDGHDGSDSAAVDGEDADAAAGQRRRESRHRQRFPQDGALWPVGRRGVEVAQQQRRQIRFFHDGSREGVGAEKMVTGRMYFEGVCTGVVYACVTVSDT